jgi:hypothetical protein
MFMPCEYSGFRKFENILLVILWTMFTIELKLEELETNIYHEIANTRYTKTSVEENTGNLVDGFLIKFCKKRIIHTKIS